MAKKKMFVQEKTVVIEFRNLKTKSGWTLTLNKATGRVQLANAGVVIYSDINSQSCKNVAERHGVQPDDWEKD